MLDKRSYFCGVVVGPPGERRVIRGSVMAWVLRSLAALAALVPTAGIGPTGWAAGPAVTFRATEFHYNPKEGSAHAGEVVFVVKNEGAIEHNFVIQDAGKKKVAEIAIMEPGTITEVRATVAPGTYAILCTLPGHREAGMAATLVVEP
jgi:plastocyanin